MRGEPGTAGRFPLPEGQSFDETDVAAIDAVAADFNRRIRERGEFLVDLIRDEVRRKWLSDDYVKAPFTTKGLHDTMGFFAQSVGSHGWAAAMTLTHEEFPEYDATELEILDLRDERDRRVESYVRARYGR